MSVRRSSRTHKPPKWIEDFEPCDTSTPIHSSDADKGAIIEVNDSSSAHVRKQANFNGKAASTIVPTTTSNHIMTHPKSKKPSRTSQAVMVANKGAQQTRDRSRSRGRGRKSTPVKSARRTSVSESVVSPTLSEISGVMPMTGIRRSTRLAERSVDGLTSFDNTADEKREDIIPAVTSHNNTSFFHVDLLSNKPRLMTFLQVTVLLIYLIVFYKLCIHFGADKFIAHLMHKLR